MARLWSANLNGVPPGRSNEMCQCQSCGSDEQIAIDDYGICVCEYCVEDEACSELVERYLTLRWHDAEETVREAERSKR